MRLSPFGKKFVVLWTPWAAMILALVVSGHLAPLYLIWLSIPILNLLLWPRIWSNHD